MPCCIKRRKLVLYSLQNSSHVILLKNNAHGVILVLGPLNCSTRVMIYLKIWLTLVMAHLECRKRNTSIRVLSLLLAVRQCIDEVNSNVELYE